jgi:hypothetical protein
MFFVKALRPERSYSFQKGRLQRFAKSHPRSIRQGRFDESHSYFDKGHSPTIVAPIQAFEQSSFGLIWCQNIRPSACAAGCTVMISRQYVTSKRLVLKVCTWQLRRGSPNFKGSDRPMGHPLIASCQKVLPSKSQSNKFGAIWEDATCMESR